ncbi:MAG: LytR C-terminal domain-containing protein [Candidatus Krumholzibacteriia bacterium]
MNRARNLILLLLVLVCGASFWLARRSGPAVADRTPGRSEARTPEPTVAAETAHLAVLNGTREPGLARRVSRLLPPLGCVVVTIADAPHDTFSRTLLVNRRLGEEQVRRLAHRLGDPVVLDEWDARCDEDAVLVLGRDHARRLGSLATP